MPSYKLLALDMDGTAYHSLGTVVTSNIKPIIAAQESGVKVVFVTGRPLSASQNQFVENGFTKHEAIAIGYNGALIYDFQQNVVVSENPIERELVINAFRESFKYDNSTNIIWAYSTDENKVFLNKSIMGTQLQPEINFFHGEKDQISENDLEKLTSCYKLLVTNCTDEYLDYLDKNGFEVAYSKHSANAEINKKGISKKLGIEFLCNKYNIDVKDTMAMGDGKNDISMLKYVAFSLAPSNANIAVKEIVDEVLHLSADEGAVAHVINKYILNKGE